MKSYRFFFTEAVALYLICNSGAALAQVTAQQIMERVDARYTGDTVHRKMTMIMIDKDGDQRVRQLEMLGLFTPEIDKSVIQFLSPADIKETEFLSYNWQDPDQQDDSWLYLPSLRKVKRIPSTDKSGAFLGSDFTYADIEGNNINRYDYRLIHSDVMVDGHACWLLEEQPKLRFKNQVEEETGYSKSSIWVRKDNHVIIQRKGLFKNGEIKYYKITRLQTIDDIATEMEMQMVTTKAGNVRHRTKLITHSVKYNVEIEQGRFNPNGLGRKL